MSSASAKIPYTKFRSTMTASTKTLSSTKIPSPSLPELPQLHNCKPGEWADEVEEEFGAVVPTVPPPPRVCVSGGETGGDAVWMDVSRRFGCKQVIAYTHRKHLKIPADGITFKSVACDGKDVKSWYSKRIAEMVTAFGYTALYAISDLDRTGPTSGGTRETLAAFVKRHATKPVYLMTTHGKWHVRDPVSGLFTAMKERPPAPSGHFLGIGASNATGACLPMVEQLFNSGYV